MTAYLAQTLKSWLETSDTRAIDIERRAGLPNSTISKILAGTHPRPERHQLVNRRTDVLA